MVEISENERRAAYDKIVPWRSLRVVVGHALAIEQHDDVDAEILPWRGGWIVLAGPLANGEHGDYQLVHRQGWTWWHDFAPYEPWFGESEVALTDEEISWLVDSLDIVVRDPAAESEPEHIGPIIARVFAALIAELEQ